MKKAILALVLFLSVGIASANTGALSPQAYYNQNKAERSTDVPLYGALEYVDYVTPNGLRFQKIACNNDRNMCYTAETAYYALGFDIVLFARGKELVEGKKIQWRSIWNAIR